MTNTFKELCPFSPKQRLYAERAEKAWFNVAEGGKRSGKNIINIDIFCNELETHPNELHFIAGYTSGTAGAIIYKSDGLGIEHYFGGRCRAGKYEDKPCYYIETATGRKVLLRSGGKDVRSQDFIAGYTFGMAYITEANRCHPKFIDEVFSRTFSSKRRKVFHDINPKSPNHWYYKDMLEWYEQKKEADPDYGYNHMSFTMADNLSMTDEQIREVIESVPKGTAFYIRDILGQRKQAEGLVYSKFNYDLHTVLAEPRAYSKYILSVDWGMRNKFAVILWGLFDNVWYAVREYGYSGRIAGGAEDTKEVTEYVNDVVKFVNGLKIERLICDPSATPFITSARKHFTVQKADNSVMEGIQDVITAFHHGLIKINRCCKELLQEIESYAFDDKKDGEDAVVKENDHYMDSKRYFVRTTKIVAAFKAKK